MKKCSFCAEEIQDDAIKCRFCGEFLDRPTISLGIGPNDTVDHFTVIREIGRGGMAVVYLAEDNSLGRQVAIKVLPPHFLNDDQLCQHFQKEARLAAKITHPNIIPVYSVGQSNTGQPYFVMAYLDGGTLGQKLKHGPIPINEALKITKEVLLALDYAHQNGIIHRDIKPDNILFSDQGFPIIADFGIAGAMAGTQTATNLGMNSGTPIYMSPELFKGEKADARSDIYAIGTMLYQMITGNPPFVRTDLPGIMFEHLSVEPEPLVEKYNEVSKQLNDVTLKALNKNPSKRYQSALEFAQSIAKCEAEQGDFEAVVLGQNVLSHDSSESENSDDMFATIPTANLLKVSSIDNKKQDDGEILKNKIKENVRNIANHSIRTNAEKVKSNRLRNLKNDTNTLIENNISEDLSNSHEVNDNDNKLNLVDFHTQPIDEKPVSKVAGAIIPALALLIYFIGCMVVMFS